MAFGIRVFNSAGTVVWDSTTAGGGIIVGVEAVAASTAPVFTYAAFPGRSAKVMSSTVGKDTGVTVDYALGYPRVTLASRAYARNIIVMVI